MKAMEYEFVASGGGASARFAISKLNQAGQPAGERPNERIRASRARLTINHGVN